MNEITYTLLSDETLDKALLPIIDWIIQAHFPTIDVQRQWADLSRLPQSTLVNSLAGRMSMLRP